MGQRSAARTFTPEGVLASPAVHQDEEVNAAPGTKPLNDLW